jgi:hypothetical protein
MPTQSLVTSPFGLMATDPPWPWVSLVLLPCWLYPVLTFGGSSKRGEPGLCESSLSLCPRVGTLLIISHGLLFVACLCEALGYGARLSSQKYPFNVSRRQYNKCLTVELTSIGHEPPPWYLPHPDRESLDCLAYHVL